MSKQFGTWTRGKHREWEMERGPYFYRIVHHKGAWVIDRYNYVTGLWGSFGLIGGYRSLQIAKKQVEEANE